MNRREFVRQGLAASGAFMVSSLPGLPQSDAAWRPRYMLASSMYGKLPLREIAGESKKTGADWLDLWPSPHGAQREEVDSNGEAWLADLLEAFELRLGCLTRYDLGPFGLDEEIRLAGRFRCPTIVTGGRGPKGLEGSELKRAVREFAEKLKPTLALAEEFGVSIAIENHGNNLMDSPDSLKWLMELRSSDHLGIALAPYHLESLGVNSEELGALIGDIGEGMRLFYAWQYGMGCMTKLPKEEELLQMPGRGPFDFEPALRAMRRMNYRGFVEVFMHPVPRGIPILPTLEASTDEIQRGRAHLETIVKQLNF